MTSTDPLSPDSERQVSTPQLDTLIRAALITVMAVLCYRIFSPFLGLMLWAVILAVTLEPLQDRLAARMGGRSGWASAVIVLLGILLILAPTGILLNSMGDSVHRIISDVQNNTLRVPPPSPGVAGWPIVGKQLHEIWMQAYTDLPALVKSMQPQLAELVKGSLGFVAGIGAGLLQFLGALVIAGILMAYGESGRLGSRAAFRRVAGSDRGESFASLCASTIRAVAQGVIGVACVQAILVGLALLIAGVPFAGVLAGVVLVLGIAQVPAVLVTLPAIIYIWSSGDYGTGAAVAHTVVLFVAGMADNILKPLLLGRGVDAPMPVILLGALGGMATSGLLGMFVGATLLALGYQIFMEWVHDNPEGSPVAPPAEPTPVSSEVGT